MNHLDYCTHYQFPADRDILTRPNFDVNIRLYLANREYRSIIISIISYITMCALRKKEGYPQPHGWSGANAGIPFNIIAFDNGTGCIDVMLNPVITRYSTESRAVQTNCGSLTLEKKKRVTRSLSIDVEFYDVNGEKRQMLNIPPTPGFTIQHEVQHTEGILI